MFLDELPHSVSYDLCKYLSFNDIGNLSKTCQQLFIFIERNNYFWMKLIENHFGSKFYQHYINEVFQNKKNSDYDLYDTDQDRENFEKRFRKISAFYKTYRWLWVVLNCKDNSDGYLAYRRIKEQKLRPRTNELKMSLTMEQIFEYYLLRNDHLTKENLVEISPYKLIYFYLIQSKRLSCLDLFPIVIRCSMDPLLDRRKTFSNYEFDSNCSTGQYVRLYSYPIHFECGIKGIFKSVLPGIYQIICRIKLDKNEDYLPYCQRHCSHDPQIEKDVQCYFYAVPDYGTACECDKEVMNYNWFESNYLLDGKTNWFNQTMGKIQIFQLSNIYFAFRILGEFRYRHILFDYIQLDIAQ